MSQSVYADLNHRELVHSRTSVVQWVDRCTALESERVGVAMPSDEGVLGVIGLTNDELAGSLRNTSRRDTHTR